MIIQTAIALALILPSCGPDPKAPELSVKHNGKVVLYGEREPHPPVPDDTQLDLVMQSPKQAAKDRCRYEYKGKPVLDGTILICRNVKKGL